MNGTPESFTPQTTGDVRLGGSGPGYPPAPTFPSPPGPQNSNRNMLLIVAAIGAALFLVAGTFLAVKTLSKANDTETTPTTDAELNFFDPEYLAADVKSEINSDISADGLSYRMNELTCIERSIKGEFTCHAEYSDGDTSTIKVTVSADGESWISSNDD
jgi:hypothetical protein